jgi:hypothetical protein
MQHLRVGRLALIQLVALVTLCGFTSPSRPQVFSTYVTFYGFDDNETTVIRPTLAPTSFPTLSSMPRRPRTKGPMTGRARSPLTSNSCRRALRSMCRR